MVDLMFVGFIKGMRLSEILSLGIVHCRKNSHWGETKIHENSPYSPVKISKNDSARFVSVDEDVREAAVRLSTLLGRHFFIVNFTIVGTIIERRLRRMTQTLFFTLCVTRAQAASQMNSSSTHS